MSKTRVRIDPDDPRSLPEGRVDHAILDATTEQDLAAQQAQDDAEAMRRRRDGKRTPALRAARRS